MLFRSRGDPHVKNADKKLLVAMVEATDDTYIFSKSIKSLTRNTLEMEGSCMPMDGRHNGRNHMPIFSHHRQIMTTLIL